MDHFSVTTYNGFSKVSGTLTLEALIAQVRGTTHEQLIRKIGRLVRAGKTDEAGNVKRQLPFFTITANYTEKRLPESLSGYNDLITIDIDGLSDEQVATLRPAIEQEPATIAAFLTAKQHGYKIVARLVNPQTESLRREYLQVEELTYHRLETYHGEIYEITRRHYEQRLGVKVDTSGKDISRGVFASYDPQAFFSGERLGRATPVTARIIAGEPAVKRGRNNRTAETTPQAIANIAPITLIEFNKCVAAVRRTMHYEEGTHNPFLFTLGNKCFARGLPEEDVKQLAAHYFSEGGKWNTNQPIANGYTYTGKTEKAEKESHKPAIEQVRTFLDTHYRFRRNTTLERLEFKKLPTGDAPEETPRFCPMATKDLNTIYSNMSMAGIKYPYASLKALVDSDYAKPYDPLEEYFNALPPWDGVTDHVGQLADTVQTTDQTYWRQIFRHWMAGMVACVLKTKNVNQQVLLLCGKQGRGKSTWLKNLLPPELGEYYRTGMINPNNKDDMQQLSTCMLINMEESQTGDDTGDGGGGYIDPNA